MGLFSKKHHDDPAQQPTASNIVMQNAPQHSSTVHTNPTLPKPDHTLQSANIDGILPSTTESIETSPVSSYTGFQDTPAPSIPNDDQNDYIMDPVPVSAPVQDNQTQDEPIYQEEAQLVQTEEHIGPSTTVSEQLESELQPVEAVTPEPQQDNLEQVLPVNIGEPAPRHTDNDDLANLKAEALKQLTPLAQHLDQSPEEKFHTTMMMLQATDDQNLVKVAFEAANAITDEKTRAQALLDVVNEINYFTQYK